MKKLLSITLLFSILGVSVHAQSGTKGLKAVPTIDPNGSVSSYSWKQTSGAAFQSFVVSSSQDSVTVTSKVAGDYTVDCTVTDNQGNPVTYTSYLRFSAYVNQKPKLIVNPQSSISNPIIVPIQ